MSNRNTCDKCGQLAELGHNDGFGGALCARCDFAVCVLESDASEADRTLDRDWISMVKAARDIGVLATNAALLNPRTEGLDAELATRQLGRELDRLAALVADVRRSMDSLDAWEELGE